MLLLTCSVDPICPRGLFRCSEGTEDLPGGALEVVRFSEGGNIDRHEEVSEVHTGDGFEKGAALKSSAQYLYCGGVAVPLVPPGILTHSAQGDEGSLSLNKIDEDLFAVRSDLSVLPDDTPLRDILPFPGTHLDLAPLGLGGGTVDAEGELLVRGHSDGEGICSIHPFQPEGGNDRWPGIGPCDPDHVLLRCHEGIVAGNAVVRGIPNCHHPHPELVRLGDGNVHGPLPDDVPHPVMPVHDSGGWGLPDDLESRDRILHPGLDAVIVEGLHPVDPVGVYPAFVCSDEDICTDPGILGWHSLPHEHVGHEAFQCFEVDPDHTFGHWKWELVRRDIGFDGSCPLDVQLAETIIRAFPEFKLPSKKIINHPWKDLDMKVIIPAAGIGKRLRPYTHTKPKPMVNVAGKTIIGHILDALKGHVTEVVLIVGYQKEKLIESVTRNFSGDFDLKFVEQKERMGLGHAIYVALKEAGSGGEILINLGDEIFGIDYGDLLEHYRTYPDLGGVLGTKKVDKPQHYGIVEETDGVITRLVEKPQNPTTNTAIAGIYLIRRSQLLFDILQEMITTGRKGKGEEFQLTDALQEMIDREERFTTYNIEEWYDCGRPEMLLDVNHILLDRMEGQERPESENSVIIEPVVVGKNCTITNSIIGPYVSLDDDTTLKDVRISNSIVGARCHLDSLILNKSIIDDDVMARGKANSLNAGQDSVIDLA